jgi:hypothetical protein
MKIEAETCAQLTVFAVMGNGFPNRKVRACFKISEYEEALHTTGGDRHNAII